MMFQWYSADGAAVHPLLVVMLALAMDVALGDPPRLWERIPHPVAVFGGLISFFERKLNRPQRSDRARFWRGLLATAFLVVLAGLAGYAVQWLCAQIDYGWVAGALIASVLIAYRSLFNHVRAVADELDISLAEGRAAVGHIVGRDPDSLDENGVARAAIESAAENFSDGVVAPIIWFALLGPQQGEPDDRCDHSVGKILRRGFDCSAGDPVFVEAVRIAAYDMPDGGTAFGERDIEFVGDRADVIEQAAIGDQHAGDQCTGDPAVIDLCAQPLHGVSCEARQYDQKSGGKQPPPKPRTVGPLWPIELAFEKRDQSAEYRHGVRDAFPKPRRVAQRDIHRQRQHHHQQGVHGCAVGAIPLKHHPRTIAPARREINCLRDGRDN